MLFTSDLEKEYENLFQTCKIRPEKLAEVKLIHARLKKNETRYKELFAPLGIPWFFVAAIHSLESSNNFNKHLLNGDPLTARTVQFPPGRPIKDPSKGKNQPYTWEESAVDALRYKRIGEPMRIVWSLARMLYEFEKWNGSGYRLHHPKVLSPYLWSFSNHYTSGKYTADNKFDESAVSTQCGAAVLYLYETCGG